MPTILSRFDMIFIVKDEHDVTKDTVSHVTWTIIETAFDLLVFPPPPSPFLPASLSLPPSLLLHVALLL